MPFYVTPLLLPVWSQSDWQIRLSLHGQQMLTNQNSPRQNSHKQVQIQNSNSVVSRSSVNILWKKLKYLNGKRIIFNNIACEPAVWVLVNSRLINTVWQISHPKLEFKCCFTNIFFPGEHALRPLQHWTVPWLPNYSYASAPLNSFVSIVSIDITHIVKIIFFYLWICCSVKYECTELWS